MTIRKMCAQAEANGFSKEQVATLRLKLETMRGSDYVKFRIQPHFVISRSIHRFMNGGPLLDEEARLAETDAQ